MLRRLSTLYLEDSPLKAAWFFSSSLAVDAVEFGGSLATGTVEDLTSGFRFEYSI